MVLFTYSINGCSITSSSFLLINKFKRRKWERTLIEVKKERRMAQLQLENLRSQMNPHFLFNALNSLQDHIISDEKKQASKFLVQFSRLMRMYLDHSRYDKITLQQEIEALTLYLSLENKRFNNQLEYHVEIASDINDLKTMVPSLFIQPYIENALLHGLLHKEGDKILTITVKIVGEQLICVITDNGIGREKSLEINRGKDHKSFATKANSNRLELMNSQESTQMSVVYKNLKSDLNNNSGTQVTIALKYEITSTDN